MAKGSTDVPVHDTEAEKAVIGSILIDNESIIHVADFLQSSDFYHNTHQKVYKAIEELNEDGESIDNITLCNVLRENGDLKSIGGATYIAKLMNEVPTASHIGQYADIVKRDSVRRRIKLAVHQFDEPEELVRRIKELEAELAVDKPKDLAQIYQDYSVEYHERKEREGIAGVNSGYKWLDENAPLEPDTLTILGARSSVGKSAFALNVAERAAGQGKRVVFISAEMSISRLMDRLWAIVTGVDANRFRKSEADADMANLKDYSEDMKNNLGFFYLPYSTSGQICKLVRKENAKSRIDLVIVDYLQYLADGKGKNENQATRVAKMTRNFKALSGQCSNAVLLLSQVNRQSTAEDGGRPKIHQLRDSGAIEQDADAVLMLNRVNRDDRTATLDLLKNRNGNADISTTLNFDPSTTRFSEMEQAETQKTSEMW